MKLEDLKNTYSFAPKMHSSVLGILNGLDDQVPFRYKKRKRTIKVILVCSIILLLSATTVVASATNIFGLFSKPVGKYGLDISIYNEPTSGENYSVNVVLGYIPQGYEQIKDETGTVIENVYSYNGDEYCTEECFSYDVKHSKNYELKETYVVDSQEYLFDSNKTIISTRQYEENGKKDYFAVKYFADFGYVVECYCDNRDELIKIMEKLELEKVESTESAGVYKEEKNETPDDSGLSYRVSDTLTFVEKGGSFDFTSLFINGVEEVPEFTKKADNFTIKYIDIEETDNCNGLQREYFLYNGNEEFIANFFDGNGHLITPYTRTDRDNGDGINSLDKTWKATDDRHFYLVTLEVTSNTEYTDFDTNSIWVSGIDKNADGEMEHTAEYGDINLVYIQAKNEFNQIDIDKGETKKIVVGVVVDDDVLEYGYLTFKTTIRNVSDDGKKVNDIDTYYCLKLKGEVDYE